MPNVDQEWVKEQFIAAKAKVVVGKAVLKMLDTWADIELTEKHAQEAIAIFSKVALNHAFIEINKDEVWAPAQAGFVPVGAEVRVMANAYSDDLGRIHNGRRGVVVGVRYGDVIINSNDNKAPKLEGAHYSPYKLEIRVK
jgi:hypothetical protein